jgi:hypothetical protein
MLSKGDRVRFDVLSSGDASVASPERFAYPPDGLDACGGNGSPAAVARARVADGLARAVRDALSGPGFSAAVRPDRREVLAARTVPSVLDLRLRAPEPVTARGVALLRELLIDGAGPLYRCSEPGALGSRLRAAAAALGPRGGV